jgi:two-component system cell cycle response regulator DivK
MLQAETVYPGSGGNRVQGDKKAKVLVVEDDFMNKILVKEILSLEGYSILEAGNGKEAVDMASKEMPDIILMDINLPEIDGVEAMRLIKANESTRDIPVLALTASVMKGDEERYLGEGFDGYVAKPVEVRKLLETVATCLSGD